MSRVPRIRFKGFEEDWEQCKLRDFGKATGGISIESEFDEYGKYKVISIGSYSEESKYTDQGIRVYKTKKTESRILNKNDLVMILNDKTSSGNIIGRVLLIDKDNTYVYNQRTERIEINKSKFLPEYLYQLLNSDNIRIKIIYASQGNTQIYVNWTVIREFTYIITTDIEEQGKIARFFITLDHLITLHQRKLEKLKIIKKSMLENLFPKNGVKTPKIRFLGFTKDWEQRKLGEIVREVTRVDENSKAPVMMITANDGFIEQSERYSTDNAGKSLKKYILLKKWELAYNHGASKIRPFGSCFALTRATNIRIPFVYHCFLALEDNPEFLEQTLNGKNVENQLRKIVSSGARMDGLLNISFQEYTSIFIRCPIRKEQDKIAILIKSIDHLITLHQSKLEKLQKIKKSMLESMFI